MSGFQLVFIGRYELDWSTQSSSCYKIQHGTQIHYIASQSRRNTGKLNGICPVSLEEVRIEPHWLISFWNI